MSELSAPRVIGFRLLHIAAGLFFGLLQVIVAFLKFLRRGRAYLRHKIRDPPSCLSDPNLNVTHHYLQLKDVNLHYASAGDSSKPLMIFLHGFPEFWYTWNKQIVEFQKDYWVVAPDLRGYGDSSQPRSLQSYSMAYLVDDVRNLIINLGRKKVILVGHDWGGMITWVFTSMYPGMVDKMIIMNSPHPLAFRKYLTRSVKQVLKSWYMMFFQIPKLPEFLFSLGDFEYIEKVFRKASGCGFSNQEIEAYKYNASKPGVLTSALNYYRCMPLSLKRGGFEYAPISVPTLILWGNKDRFLDVGLVKLSSQYVKTSCVEILSGATHWPHRECYITVNRNIRKFLKDYDS